MSAHVTVRREPTAADLARLAAAAAAAVQEIAKADGALGHEQTQELYIRRMYAAFIAGEMKPAKRRGKRARRRRGKNS